MSIVNTANAAPIPAVAVTAATAAAAQQSKTNGGNNVIEAIAGVLVQNNKAMEVMAEAIRTHTDDIAGIKNSISGINARIASDAEKYDALEERCATLEKANEKAKETPIIPTPVAPKPSAKTKIERTARFLVCDFTDGKTNRVNGAALYEWFCNAIKTIKANAYFSDNTIRAEVYQRVYTYSAKNKALKCKVYSGSRARYWCEGSDVELIYDLIRATYEVLYEKLRI